VSTREFSRQSEDVQHQRAPLRRAEDFGRGWRWWAKGTIVLVLIALLVGVVVYLISDRFPASYQSSAIVRVSVQATSGISDPAVTASNDLASQYAQLASTSPIEDAAALQLGVPSSGLSGSVTAGTIAAQNLIRITASGSSAAQAEQRATAVAKAFVAYVDSLNTQQAQVYTHAVTSKLVPLQREISAVRAQLHSSAASTTTGGSETQHDGTVLLTGLVGQERTVLSSIAQSSAAAQPDLQLIAPGGTASQVSPRPKLYAAIGVLAVLLILGRALYIVGVKRPAFPEAPV